ncbi:ferritin-like domain-containing protein [Crepidotus variabilis]|uniref:Ferritin-like domain-containing protein n=1 Tax=Crepidotus variabilis TaxID=179855 RepID=A0A9P6ECX1_9AGAR|nr:ferritin-like domain-containing protein [Crepidotus variabilis]
MLFTSSLVSLLAAASVSALPALTKRAAADILVFKFADVLEQLESQFYSQALAKFKDSDFAAAGFGSSQVLIEQFQVIQADEDTHSKTLQAALKSFGQEPITSCKFNFESALKDVGTMAATARIVESVGVSAYLGAASLLTDPRILTSAGSILTTEARHQTFLNMISPTGTTIPNAFDFALTPSEVLTLALPFVDPSSPCDTGVKPNPILSVTNAGTIGVGTKLTFASDALNSTVDQSKLFCQMLVGGVVSTISLPLSECAPPAGINGPVAIWITSDPQPLLNDVTDRATTQIVAGPLMTYIDTQPQLVNQLIRASGGAVAATSTSTTTISPAQASSIIVNAPAAGPPASGAAPVASSSPAASGSAAPAASTASPSGPSADGAITVMGMANVPAS